MNNRDLYSELVKIAGDLRKVGGYYSRDAAKKIWDSILRGDVSVESVVADYTGTSKASPDVSKLTNYVNRFFLRELKSGLSDKNAHLDEFFSMDHHPVRASDIEKVFKPFSLDINTSKVYIDRALKYTKGRVENVLAVLHLLLSYESPEEVTDSEISSGMRDYYLD